jgi:hypothetical protein
MAVGDRYRRKNCLQVRSLKPLLFVALHPTTRSSLSSVQPQLNLPPSPYKARLWTDVQFLCRAQGQNGCDLLRGVIVAWTGRRPRAVRFRRLFPNPRKAAAAITTTWPWVVGSLDLTVSNVVHPPSVHRQRRRRAVESPAGAGKPAGTRYAHRPASCASRAGTTRPGGA